MTDDLLAQVDAWFSAYAVPRPGNAPTLDATQLVERDAEPEALLDAAARAFAHAAERWAPQLPAVHLLLMIPLKPSDAVEPAPPAWSAVASQLDRSPPSIYVIAAEDMKLPFLAEQRIASVAPPPALSPSRYRAKYMCWRRDDADPEDGWSRDIRVELRER
jgi:hypothetical protein